MQTAAHRNGMLFPGRTLVWNRRACIHSRTYEQRKRLPL